MGDTARRGLDGDDRKARERLCILTRQTLPIAQMLRFVASPDGVLIPDIKHKLPGRGIWIKATRAAVEEAVRRKVFERALKRSAHVPADLPDHVESLLERAALDWLSLANKAGLVTSGFAAVAKLIEQGVARILLEAQDGAPDGVRKLAAMARRCYKDDEAPAVITIFTSLQLDLALGRTHVIHAALGAGGALQGFLDRVAALEFWRDGGLLADVPLPETSSAEGKRQQLQEAGPATGAARTE